MLIMVRNRLFITILLIGIATIVSASIDLIAQPEWINNGLIAYYPFDGDANDLTGNGHHGKIRGAQLTKDRFGHPDSAYAFDGDDDVIIVPDHEVLDFRQANFTLAAWFSPQVNDAHCYLIGKYKQEAFPGYGMGLSSGKSAYAFLGDSNLENGFVQAVTSYTIPFDKWHFMVATFDRNGNLTLYVDGLKHSSVLLTSEDSETGSDHALYIGNLSHGAGFKGAIDDVYLYNRALTEAEVSQIYAYQSPPKIVTNNQPNWINDGLVAYYPLDGDTADHSGNGNDAVLKGNATFEEMGGLLFDEAGDRLGLPFAVNQNEISFSLFYTPRFYFEGVEDWLTVLAREGG